MTWSLQVRNGDLVLGGGGLATVTGRSKLVQDFRHHLLEHMGDDPAHPNYGSLFDGGIMSDGSLVTSVIGETIGSLVEARITDDIHRLATLYQAAQLERVKNDRDTYQKTTVTGDEILASISNIALVQQEDTLFVTISITTAAGNSADLNLSLSGIFPT